MEEKYLFHRIEYDHGMEIVTIVYSSDGFFNRKFISFIEWEKLNLLDSMAIIEAVKEY